MYYPSSQIKTNLYTNGGELVKKDTKLDYIGFYWRTSSSKYFTGKTPDDLIVEELELKLVSTDDNLNADAYSYLNQNSVSSKDYIKLNTSFSTPLLLPLYFNPKPNNDDYEIGEFTRYFVKKSNELIYLEINEETHNKLLAQNPSYLFHLYIPFKYKWKLTGIREEVYFTNQKVTQYMSEKFNLPMLNKFLKEDFLKFYI